MACEALAYSCTTETRPISPRFCVERMRRTLAATIAAWAGALRTDAIGAVSRAVCRKLDRTRGPALDYKGVGLIKRVLVAH